MATASRIRRILRNVGLILLALIAIFFLGVVPWFFTSILTQGTFHYPDANDGKTPKSFNLDFQWIEFSSPDGVPLKGWYIPAEGAAKGTIVYCHGLNRTRVEMLPNAVFGHSLRYNGLLFDFRHQGMSGGKITTLGYQERLDVQAAVRYALDHEHAARPVVVWGVSMGAASALMAAAETPEIDAVISDSSYDSFLGTLGHHLKLFLHLPAFPIAYEVGYWTAWRGNFHPGDFDLVKAVDRIGNRPILFVAVEGDRRMPPSIAQTLYSHARSPLRKILVLPGIRHGEGFNQARAPYEKAVTDFLANLSSGRSGQD
ncbi:MAG TPA: alpha/beta hydrolase [Terriglobia bacterium]|nr:alpha/beta hydrolase [Terriglobia bacterium]